MKVNSYWLNTPSYLFIYARLPRLDANLVLFLSGKALGVFNDR